LEELSDIALAEEKLITQLKHLFSYIRKAGQAEPSNLETSLEILKSLRHLVYEDMNQLQHEALILKAAKFLQTELYPTISIKWLWNPRQTGTNDEPDLRGLDQEKHVVASAEITTSLMPQGSIDTRMARTLQKLSIMEGDKYYIIATEEMERRSKSKLTSLGYQIKVLRL
jgi:hypothetical protein